MDGPRGRLRAVAGLALALISGCAAGGPRTLVTSTTTRPPQIVVSPYEEIAFLEMAGHASADDRSGPSPRTVEKWTHDVHVAIAGAPTPADLAEVQRGVAELGPLLAPRHVVAGGGRDVVVQFVPRSQFAAVLGSAAFPAYADGVTQPQVGTGAAAGTLRSVVVVIDTGIPQYGRNHVIAHELLHAVGLNHSTCKSSVMFAQSRTDTSPAWSLSPFDRRMVSLLYRPEVTPGMSPHRLERVLTPTAASGVQCAPVTWQVVVDSDTHRPYFCAVTAERYRPCTSDVDVEPTLPITAPDLWYDGTYAYARRPPG